MATEEPARRAIVNSLTHDLSRILIRDPRREWTAGQILGAAAVLREKFAAGGQGPVGIACAQGGWVMASMLAAWSTGRRAIVIDPGLKKETDSLRKLFPDIPVYADRGEPGDGRELVAELLEKCAPAAAPPAWLALPGDQDFFVGLFTSGSEGDAKVVQKMGLQPYRQALALAGVLGLPPRSRVLSFVPPFHLLGFFYGLILPLVVGAETVVATELTGAAMLQLLGKYRPRLVVGTATHYRVLSRVPATGAASALSPEVICLSSGAPLDPASADAFARRFGLPVREWYGSTELGGVAYRAWPEPYQPMPGVEWRIDPETARLEVKSTWSGAGDAWIATDDAAEPEGEGRFRLLGRLSHMVKVGGKRFSSVEVEQALRAMPGVTEAAVVPYDRFAEQAIAAFIAVEAGAEITEEAVRSFLLERLATFKLPRTIRFLAKLPRVRAEKVDYMALKALAKTGEPDPTAR